MTELATASFWTIAEQDWDCLVIGAGPAGSLAARQSALLGLKTLLVERKAFPRDKVCGACLNHSALQVLESVGLGDLPRQCGGIPLHRLHLRSRQRELSLELPGGLALSRAVLDQALARAAVSAGAVFLPSTTAVIRPEPAFAPTRTVQLQLDQALGQAAVEIRSKAVVAADGLGHPALRLLSEFPERVAPASRIGVGALLRSPDLELEPGTIHMAMGLAGYVGLVRVEGGLLNVAAALDPQVVKEQAGLPEAVNQILQEAGYKSLASPECQWTGTRLLTRSSDRVAGWRVFAVGDATGYVEPFTGEGMAWALAGGRTVAECVAAAVRSNPLRAAEHWQQEWARLISSRQSWCRRLAALLRHPVALNLAMLAAAGFPGLATPIVRRINTSYLSSKAGIP